MALDFGIFDHVDRSDLPLTDFYENRFKLIEGLRPRGLYALSLRRASLHAARHVALPERVSFRRRPAHQAASLRPAGLHTGALPSAAACRRNLHARPDEPRAAGLVGVGKGISPIEMGYYGVDPAKTDKIFGEAIDRHHAGADAEVGDVQGRVFRVQRRADGVVALSAAASAAVVRRGDAGQRGAGGGAEA